ncbi:MAG: N-6 DNA methylase [Sulfurimonas sp.]|nr:N-6 DNA methylase [Sulfurimonas sp.]
MNINDDINTLITALEFIPKENCVNIYQKKYVNHNNYIIELDLDKNTIHFGKSIFFNNSKNSIQKITKDEDLVVLECVDRLLNKDYPPQNLVLEKVYPSGHGTSGRLDILVTNDDGSAYMMIECKTWTKEFDKAFSKQKKDGGQLFTYFQQDKKAEVLVLYASDIIAKRIEYKNEIVKIEEEYKTTSNVRDLYDRWNKTSKNNGVFNNWNTAYNYESKALTPKDLVDIKQEDSSFIFNRFMEILRHNVVSDKPNAFNKIFTLFLCKIMDEKHTSPDKELEFQWLEGIDTHVAFQKRLTNLYQRGMKEFLDKEVTDLSDDEFEEKFGTLDNSVKQLLLEEFTKIRLQKNNEFAIKDVFDQETFEENAIVVKEIVELLQNFKIRYAKKQQFLSDFFELLLTTGLKQEVGQFFTPVPIARFIIRSIPFDKIIKEKLLKGERDELLPNVIDYAVGSGHFITEAMDEIQKELNRIETDPYIQDTTRKIKSWKTDHFDWAYDYVYGIEKDYRLVKTAKVGCYLHGDGLAKVIHGDGLSNFTNTKEYKGKLNHQDKNYPQDNKKFDIVVSNPPYSVSAFKNISKKFNSDDFELYDKLTDQSSEIEALFIERTKQLLKDGGIAGIILPSSILSNGGIYTKTREIILNYFDIVSITELGSSTFMATGTNTVVLFLRRKNNMIHVNIKASVNKLFENKQDITIHGVEKPLSKYISHVWEDIDFDDYISLLEQTPNDKILSNGLYGEYNKKYNTIDEIVELEKEKVCFFIMAYFQKVTVVKTGEKKKEKQFLGYEFSNRRGSEGIHPIQRGKSIDECTSLFDANSYENNLKVNSYIYSAFSGEEKEIDESLKDNISYVDLVDMMTFDRSTFEKSVSLSVKKKVNIGIKYEQILISNSLDKIKRNTTKISKDDILEVARIPVVTQEQNNLISGYTNNEEVIDDLPLVVFGDHSCSFKFIDFEFIRGADGTVLLKPDSRFIIKYYYIILSILVEGIIENKNKYERHYKYLKEIKIPLAPKDIQEKIVYEIEELEKKEKNNKKEIEQLKQNKENIFIDIISNAKTIIRLNDTDTFSVTIGKRVLKGDVQEKEKIPIYSANVFEPFGYIDKHLLDTYNTPSVIWGIDGDWMVNCLPKEKAFYPTDHCGVLRVKNNTIDEQLLAYILNKEGESLEFSRTKRASIERIKGIKIPLASIKEQKEMTAKIQIIDKKIIKKRKRII